MPFSAAARSTSILRARRVERAAWCVLLLYATDRLLRGLAVAHFFRRPPPPAPQTWPSVTLIQPLTRGASALPEVLAARAALDYPAPLQQLLVCDAGDAATQAICRAYQAAHPEGEIQLMSIAGARPVADKITKLQAALPSASGAVLCFVDDDVLLRRDALRVLLPYLDTPAAGAVFGLACAVSWGDPWSSLLSLFVNANALPTYVAGCYLAEPFTITGHCFALRREVFAAAGGFEGMEGRFDDDHELARRVRRLGLRCIQTPLVYDVANNLGSLRAYSAQIKRWFVMPRQALLPFLTPREQALLALSGLATLLPGLLAVLALLARSSRTLGALLLGLGICAASYAQAQRCCQRRTPFKRWLLLPVAALLPPAQALWASCTGDVIEWRGRRLRVLRGGGSREEA